MRKRLAIILTLMMIFTLGSAYSCFADDSYGYVLNIYTGNQGVFKDDGSKARTIKLASGEHSPAYDINDIKVTNSKYYVRGFRIAGHDNDETVDEPTGYTNLGGYVASGDASYEVAYGIRGKLVKYTVRYVDANNNELAPSDTYYGMPGDKPVASYRYIEGYDPDAYYKAQPLDKDPNKNVFTFKYTRNNGGANANGNAAADGGNGNANGGANGAGANGNAAGVGNANVGPAAPGTAGNPAGNVAAGNTTTINPNQTPRGTDLYQDLDEGGLSWQMLAALGGFLTLLLIALILFLLKRRHRGEELDDIIDDDFLDMK